MTTGVEVRILFKDWKFRPDVDNVEKKIVDALKGVAFVDDRQVRYRTAAIVNDAVVASAGDGHLTFDRLQRGKEFLIIIILDPPTRALRSR